jgi:hypothetical protein
VRCNRCMSAPTPWLWRARRSGGVFRRQGGACKGAVPGSPAGQDARPAGPGEESSLAVAAARWPKHGVFRQGRSDHRAAGPAILLAHPTRPGVSVVNGFPTPTGYTRVSAGFLWPRAGRLWIIAPRRAKSVRAYAGAPAASGSNGDPPRGALLRGGPRGRGGRKSRGAQAGCAADWPV